MAPALRAEVALWAMLSASTSPRQARPRRRRSGWWEWPSRAFGFAAGGNSEWELFGRLPELPLVEQVDTEDSVFVAICDSGPLRIERPFDANRLRVRVFQRRHVSERQVGGDLTFTYVTALENPN